MKSIKFSTLSSNSSSLLFPLHPARPACEPRNLNFVRANQPRLNFVVFVFEVGCEISRVRGGLSGREGSRIFWNRRYSSFWRGAIGGGGDGEGWRQGSGEQWPDHFFRENQMKGMRWKFHRWNLCCPLAEEGRVQRDKWKEIGGTTRGTRFIFNANGS